MALPAALAFVVFLALGAPVSGDGPVGPFVEVRITQKYLQPLCLDGVPVQPGGRKWRLDLREHSLALTMRNEPRRGAPGSSVAPGIAVVRFTPEAGHQYEIEIRAPESTYSWRVWKQGAWKPVVRDRTGDRLVGSEPEWRAAACEP